MGSRQAPLPEDAAICARYEPPRRLRTRTMGTPFWVRSESGNLIVTPASGVGRLVRMGELQATWPHIAGGAPRAVWKDLTNNGSYLEAIYDDLQEAQQTAPLVAQAAGPVVRDAQHRLERCTEEYVTLRDRYRIETKHLQEEVRSKTTEVIRIRMELETAREALHAERRTRSTEPLDALRAELDRERASRQQLEHLLQAARSEAQQTIEGMRVLHEALTTANTELRSQLGEAIDARDEAEAAVADVAQRLRVAELKSAHAEESAKLRKGDTIAQDDAVSAFTQLTLSLGVTDRIPEPRQREALISASERLGVDPDAAVAECRRVLERCSRTMWEDAFPERQAPGRFSDAMFDIRSTGVVPEADWHLMKNLYSRASDIVHNGGGTKQAALMIWLGTAEVAELAGAKRPVAMTHVAA